MGPKFPKNGLWQGSQMKLMNSLGPHLYIHGFRMIDITIFFLGANFLNETLFSISNTDLNCVDIHFSLSKNIPWFNVAVQSFVHHGVAFRLFFHCFNATTVYKIKQNQQKPYYNIRLCNRKKFESNTIVLAYFFNE